MRESAMISGVPADKYNELVTSAGYQMSRLNSGSGHDYVDIRNGTADGIESRWNSGKPSHTIAAAGQDQLKITAFRTPDKFLPRTVIDADADGNGKVTAQELVDSYL